MATIMSAIRTTQLGYVSLRDNVPIPEVPAGYVLIRTSHVALNPTDWKHVDYPELFKPDHTLGFAGTIVQIGAGSPVAWKVGDRVAGASWGCRARYPDSGSFAEFSLIKSHLAVKIPPRYSLAQAATLPIGCITSFASLYLSFQLPWPGRDFAAPPAEPLPILIYGGSTSSGLFAIQFAKSSGLRVVTTCSPRNFDKVKAVGADVVVDYADAAQCATAIHEATDGKLLYALDCVANSQSAEICAESLTKEVGKARYSSLLPVEFPRSVEDVIYDMIVVFPAWGEDVYFGDSVIFPAQPEQALKADKFMRLLEQLLESDRIKTFETMREGGLLGVCEGLNELRSGKVSGQKLVYQL